MARKQTPNKLKIPLELLESIDEARLKLSERIAKGRVIMSTPINTVQDLDAAKKSYSTTIRSY